MSLKIRRWHCFNWKTSPTFWEWKWKIYDRIQWFFSFFRSSLYVYRSVNDSSNSFVDNLFRQLIFFQNENWYHRYKNRTIKKIERRKSIKGIVEIGIFRYGYTMRLQYACLITIALNQDTKIKSATYCWTLRRSMITTMISLFG